ncbi:LCP family protein [Lacrimispora saccharolytica]|uniref:Cell envelope-related transcriptional attenuator n=1 Tax=Lacrimispora saccharolytica (strain ATCC 35040 / DSM 2544 / NRCC 2533 / WM1) TaxID=610130 RepID=D9R147_LACSW|nr:LCP family protein [Lacrimispora saccharolytica]ADL04594.1 cell envelope-related transcriptional attenuator [[Clostridium] saccharolyticum WM1]QRV22022.1 LCP family protein [Lacrimispora saccharolytica]
MDYEDELDRMRARKRREGSKKAGSTDRAHPAERKRPEQAVRGDRTYYSTGDGRNPRVRYNGPQNNARHKADKKRKRKHKQRVIFTELVILALVLFAGFFLLKQRTHEKGFWTIAVFGVDSRDGSLEKGALSDVEMICNIDKATGEIKLVSVYRDTYLKINSKGTYHKINEAYFKGGHKQAVEALNENLDLNIDDYATFNWKAVADAINILGGVDLEITDSEFAYINGFITETVKSTGVGSYQLKKAGMNHLDGVQAVAYARLRLMDTDFNRTERQRKVVSLAMEKAKKADFGTLSTLVTAVFPQISTSVGMNDVLSIAKGISKYHIGETTGFPFSRTTMKIGKMDCVIPTTLESNVIQLHQFLYNKENHSPSSAVKKISDKISQESGISEPGKNAPSGGGSGGKKKENSSAPKETAPAQTEPSAHTTVEESTMESTKETTAEAVEESTEPPTNDDGSLVGPGANIKETKETQEEKTKETKPEKEVQENQGNQTGPGAADEEVGPGIE